MNRNQPKVNFIKVLGISFLLHLVTFLPGVSGYIGGIFFGKKLPNRSVFWTLIPAFLATALLDLFYIGLARLSSETAGPGLEGVASLAIVLFALALSPLSVILAPIGAFRAKRGITTDDSFKTRDLVQQNSLLKALFISLGVQLLLFPILGLFGISAFLGGFVFGKRVPERSFLWPLLPAVFIFLLGILIAVKSDIPNTPADDLSLPYILFLALILMVPVPIGAFIGKKLGRTVLQWL